jgi:hypothetical protein
MDFQFKISIQSQPRFSAAETLRPAKIFGGRAAKCLPHIR